MHRPNMGIISYLFLEVNKYLYIVHKFMIFYNLILCSLYNIPSCKNQIRGVLYSYKEVIPMY